MRCTVPHRTDRNFKGGNRMNVLIMDDHPLVRQGLTSALSFEKDIEEIHEASTLEEAKIFLKQKKPEMTIIDLYLGREDGLK